MPEVLRKFLEVLQQEDVEALLEYLDENPFAADEMIEILSQQHFQKR